MRQPYAPPGGLCESCACVRIVDTKRGSRFYLCQRSDVDPRFPKYPRTPVLRCIGYAPTAAPDVITADPGAAG